MKKLAKLFIATLFIAVVFRSCKKGDSNNSSAFFMKFNANGTNVSFNNCVEVTATVGTTPVILITGNNLNKDKVSDNSFEVEISHDPLTIAAGQTYPAATIFGQTESSTLIYFLSDSDFNTTQPGSAQGTVTITEVNASLIKGTFSGKLFAHDDFNGEHVTYTVTNGSFSAQRGN